MDVALAALGGTGNTGSGGRFRQLFGTTEPLDVAELIDLYPTLRAFRNAWINATEKAVVKGHIRLVDGHLLIDAAAKSQIPWSHAISCNPGTTALIMLASVGRRPPRPSQ